jgi:glycosyltransferase involved in cell wall biosynthesis
MTNANFGLDTDIIVPCRNEAGILADLLKTILEIIKPDNKIIIVEGGSTDGTFEVANTFAEEHPESTVLLRQQGKGKFNAVMEGINLCTSEYVMIWDADGTVDLKSNISIYSKTHAENFFITGDRLVGMREKGSMQKANLVANKVFALIWGFLLKSKPVDSLCGSKKFPRFLLVEADTRLISNDPYGDFTILAMARRKRLSMFSVPVEYSARRYGTTNIHRWSGGVKLLKILFLAIRLHDVKKYS